MHATMWAATALVLRLLAGYQARARSKVRYADLIDNRWLFVYGILCVGAAYALGLPDVEMSLARVLISAVAAPLLAAVTFTFVATVIGPWLLPRFVVTAAPLALSPVYAMCSLTARRSWNRSAARERVFLVATSEDTSKLAGELESSTELPVSLVGTLDPSEALPRRVGHEPLVDAVREAKATLVVLNEDAQSRPLIIEQVASLHEAGIRVRPLTAFYEIWLGKLPVYELTRMHLMFDIGEVHTTVYGRMKRSLDVLVALVGIPVLLIASPFVALANLFGNRGPLLFSQERVGLNGQTFQIHKFRTMRPTSTGSGEWTQLNDPRITGIGRVLRATHVDELPQIWNILLGDISLVGPRPEQVHYVRELSAKIPHYAMRHTIRPGLTGWAQVKYPYGANDADALEKLEYELYYLGHQGPALDARIVSRTMRSVFGRQGR